MEFALDAPWRGIVVRARVPADDAAIKMLAEAADREHDELSQRVAAARVAGGDADVLRDADLLDMLRSAHHLADDEVNGSRRPGQHFYMIAQHGHAIGFVTRTGEHLGLVYVVRDRASKGLPVGAFALAVVIATRLQTHKIVRVVPQSGRGTRAVSLAGFGDNRWVSRESWSAADVARELERIAQRSIDRAK